jgi:hypothetical protein
MVSGIADNIQELEEIYYGKGAHLVDQTAKITNKADSNVESGTTGVFNAIYGAEAWSQLNDETRAFGTLPKYPWPQSGFRVITERGGTANDGGVPEGGDIPDTIKPTWKEIDADPKTVSHTFGVSEIQEALSDTDDTTGDIAFMRSQLESTHRKRINQHLLTDVDTLAGDNMESIDRVVSSQAEEARTSVDAGDADLYGGDVDRSATTDFDAVVNQDTSSNRSITEDLVRDLKSSIEDKSGETPDFILTGRDTRDELVNVFGDLTRYDGLVGTEKIQVSVNGIETAEGQDLGQEVAKVLGLPVITDSEVPKDGISRLYMLNTSDPMNRGRPNLGISVLKPTQYFEAGIDVDQNPFSIGQFVNKGMYRTIGELMCLKFSAQGKLRDLSAA